MTIAHDADERGPALEEAFRYDTLALAERYLAGARDLEVGVIGNDRRRARAVRPGGDRLRPRVLRLRRQVHAPACPRLAAGRAAGPTGRRSSSSPATPTGRSGPRASPGSTSSSPARRSRVARSTPSRASRPISLFPTCRPRAASTSRRSASGSSTSPSNAMPRGCAAARAGGPAAMSPAPPPGGPAGTSRGGDRIRRASAGLTPIRAGAFLVISDRSRCTALVASDAFAFSTSISMGAALHERFGRPHRPCARGRPEPLPAPDRRLAAALRQLPTVKDAAVSVALPDTVRVALDEREPILVWHTAAGRFLVDDQAGPLRPGRCRARPSGRWAPVLADRREPATDLDVGATLDPVDLDAATRLGVDRAGRPRLAPRRRCGVRRRRQRLRHEERARRLDRRPSATTRPASAPADDRPRPGPRPSQRPGPGRRGQARDASSWPATTTGRTRPRRQVDRRPRRPQAAGSVAARRGLLRVHPVG